jgi:hypothetical protein
MKGILCALLIVCWFVNVSMFYCVCMSMYMFYVVLLSFTKAYTWSCFVSSLDWFSLHLVTLFSWASDFLIRLFFIYSDWKKIVLHTHFIKYSFTFKIVHQPVNITFKEAQRRVIIGKYTKNKPVNIIYQEDPQRIIIKCVIILNSNKEPQQSIFKVNILIYYQNQRWRPCDSDK